MNYTVLAYLFTSIFVILFTFGFLIDYFGFWPIVCLLSAFGMSCVYIYRHVRVHY